MICQVFQVKDGIGVLSQQLNLVSSHLFLKLFLHINQMYKQFRSFKKHFYLRICCIQADVEVSLTNFTDVSKMLTFKVCSSLWKEVAKNEAKLFKELPLKPKLYELHRYFVFHLFFMPFICHPVIRRPISVLFFVFFCLKKSLSLYKHFQTSINITFTKLL